MILVYAAIILVVWAIYTWRTGLNSLIEWLYAFDFDFEIPVNSWLFALIKLTWYICVPLIVISLQTSKKASQATYHYFDVSVQQRKLAAALEKGELTKLNTNKLAKALCVSNQRAARIKKTEQKRQFITTIAFLTTLIASSFFSHTTTKKWLL